MKINAISPKYSFGNALFQSVQSATQTYCFPKLEEELSLSLDALASANSVLINEPIDYEDLAQSVEEILFEPQKEDEDVIPIEILSDPFKAFMYDIKDIPPNTAEENLDLVHKYQQTHSKEAREKLINGNLRLVVAIAKKYIKSGVDLLDAIMVGTTGLMDAAETFDETKGKFSTYAGDLINWKIGKEYKNTSRTIRVPIYVLDAISRAKRAENQMKNEGKKPDMEEVAETINVPYENLKEYFELTQRADALSLDTPVGESEDGTTLGDFVPDESKNSFEFNFQNILDRDEIERLTKDLLPSQKEVLTLSFGLNGAVPMTNEEIAKYKNISTTRVDQIKQKAIRMIRKNNHIPMPLNK